MNRFREVVTILLALFGSGLLTPTSFAANSPTTQQSTQDQQLQKLWDDLENTDPEASRALLKLSTMPDQAVAFLKDQLTPLTLSTDDMNKLLADLGSDDDSVWKPAFEKLDYLDPRLALDLQTLMADVTEPVARNRMVEILSGHPADSLQGKSVNLRPAGDGEFNFFDGNASWWAEAKLSRIGEGRWEPKNKWTRAIRAIVLLEHIGSADAILILKDMATGNPDAGPTKAAKDALTNLGVAGN